MKLSLRIAALAATLALTAAVSQAQSLSAKWEDLTSADFVKAIKQSGGFCMLPVGDLEKWGPTGPLGTNLYLVRVVALEAAKQDYGVVFPEYFASVITAISGEEWAIMGSGRGTISYSMHLQTELMEETTSEMARNGCKKILIVNGHSPNMQFLATFVDDFHRTPHDYSLYYVYGDGFPVTAAQYAKLPKDMQPTGQGVDGHGGEERIAAMLAYYPDLVHLDRAHDETVEIGHGTATEGQNPKHIAVGFMDAVDPAYSGDPSGATAARGKALMKYSIDRLVLVIKDIKADNTTLATEKKYAEQMKNPDAAK